MGEPCRYTEAFNEAASQLETQLEKLLSENFRELEEKSRAIAQLVEREPERVRVKERLSWLLNQEAKLQEALARMTSCARCNVLPEANDRLLGCSNGHLTCKDCLPEPGISSLASCSTCGEAVDKRSLLAVTVVEVIRRDCRHPGCLAPYNPSSASSHVCLFVEKEQDHVIDDAKGDNPLVRAQRRVLKLEAKIKHSEKVHKEAVRELNKDLCALSDKIEEVAKVETELQTVESKLIEALECPVCWEVAAEGVFLRCPNDHLVCEPCYKSMNQSKEALCPTCRVPIGSSISLLAGVVRQNVRHVCGNTGCGERILFQDVPEHRRVCPLSAENLEKNSGVSSILLECPSSQLGRMTPVRFALPVENGDGSSKLVHLTFQLPVNTNLEAVKKWFTKRPREISGIVNLLSPAEAQYMIQARIYDAFSKA